MKQWFLLIAINFVCISSRGQQVPKTVIAEHFTNTYCSVCASNNPGLFSNLTTFPQVLHVAYYPSAPYVACPLSMHNPTENDARTNYYGIYGATPRLVVGGNVIAGSLTDPAIYTSQLPATTSFTLNTSFSFVGADSVEISVIIKKVDTSSLTALTLFGAVVEDTLVFPAHNGETMQVDVFRKAFWGTAPLSITAPATVGDSSVFTKTVALNTVWNKSRLYAVAVIQKSDKQVVQASKSGHIPGTAGVSTIRQGVVAISVHPNPSRNTLFIDRELQGSRIVIADATGAYVCDAIINQFENSVDISALNAGAYFLIVGETSGRRATRFIKQ